MKKHSMFSVAHLKVHADALIDAVNGSNEVVVISRNGAAKAVLQDVESFESLRRAVSLLEELASRHSDVLEGARSEIDSVLSRLGKVSS
ncbi:type II toxin-antitoxin system prevent-host-death family antitoxin [Paraburkholderia sp. C35]|uniref:type II toxin-antitoxin system prevent-host-death family antitoxin n=1 Tax=Paraburkholderia sp. C35 TaxID=2126993 RepID=UPI000D699249|nr:type II toxin-antitoxin system prevent-host-death family antitoxin [Paraburkholderia sp. C35]